MRQEKVHYYSDDKQIEKENYSFILTIRFFFKWFRLISKKDKNKKIKLKPGIHNSYCFFNKR